MSSTEKLERYYRFHARIYDATRWTFLFGRSRILHLARQQMPAPRRVLEVGCGTGRNLERLALLFPRAELVGVDIAKAMLDRARRRLARFGARVRLVERPYGAPLDPGAHDTVLFSYALTMFNPGFEAAIAAARADLALGGVAAAVDFHDTPLRCFEAWMARNHVRMQAHVRPALLAHFEPYTDEVCRAYGGAWRYFLFAGRPRSGAG